MRPFCVPFGLPHHAHAAEILGDDCSPEVYAETNAEELAMRRQVNAECAAIDDCAANMLSDSVFFGGDGFAPGDGAAVHRFIFARDLFRAIRNGEKDAIVEEHARAALARNDAGSLTHAIQEVLRRCEAALAKPRVIRREACHIGPCMRAIQRDTRAIHTYAAEIRGDAATIDEELAMRRPVNAEYAAIAAVFARCGTAR